MSTSNWKMLTCKLISPGDKFECGQKFGRALQLREHQATVHNHKFASAEDLIRSALEAKRLLEQLQNDGMICNFLEFHSQYYLDDGDDRSWRSRIMNVLDRPAFKELD